jgi:hypothetical protein
VINLRSLVASKARLNAALRRQRSLLLHYAFPDDFRIANRSDRMPSVTLLLVNGWCYISVGCLKASVQT